MVHEDHSMPLSHHMMNETEKCTVDTFCGSACPTFTSVDPDFEIGRGTKVPLLPFRDGRGLYSYG